MADEKDITITIKKENGKLVCDPPQAEADHNWKIKFKSDYQFVLHFGTDSPFFKFKGKGKKDSPEEIQVKHDPKSAGARIYKYTVAIWDPDAEKEEEKLQIIDPEIIIPPLGI